MAEMLNAMKSLGRIDSGMSSQFKVLRDIERRQAESKQPKRQTMRDISNQLGNAGHGAMQAVGLNPFGSEDPNDAFTADRGAGQAPRYQTVNPVAGELSVNKAMTIPEAERLWLKWIGSRYGATEAKLAKQSGFLSWLETGPPGISPEEVFRAWKRFGKTVE